ncbi:histidine triad nucleotide-binding protein 3 [Caerostris darwini]|uniref:Adenosine 5'-monophosphoramidase HINT3 n=1 Tax=Caerostris darwini TaxID=1538125 RepID=A0AAV4V9U3_9ARAC|nr:histidine triad nucleotide-binding protein 3 [Caerostris darwini]
MCRSIILWSKAHRFLHDQQNLNRTFSSYSDLHSFVQPIYSNFDVNLHKKKFYPKMTDVKKDEKCLFCCIKDKSTEIIFEDEEYLAFRDIKPATSHHYLIIPKSHMTNTSSLLPSDIPIVKRLVEIGEIILKNNSASISDARFGFHVPPFNSIRHLHLHAISCVNEMGFISRLIFKPDSYWFITASTLIEKLENSNENEKGN